MVGSTGNANGSVYSHCPQLPEVTPSDAGLPRMSTVPLLLSNLPLSFAVS